MISNTLAFRMSIKDVDAHYFENAPNEIFCPECGSVLDESYIPKALSVRSGWPFAFGATYDGKALCSTAMRELMNREGLDVEFWEVNAALGLYRFQPGRQLAFDTEKRRTRFIGPCSRCGQFSEVIGSQPVFLRDVNAPITKGIFRTDVEFGSGRSKGPAFIVGLQTKEVLARAKHGGCTYLPILQG